jgi:predicted nucleotide-binding protein
MITRFQGRDGKARRIEALRLTHIVRDEQVLAEELEAVADIIQIEPKPPDNEFIKQDATDTDIYLILAGKVSIRVNGREIAIRGTRDHIGEMALIDPTARRSATVAATEQTVLAKIPEARFTQIANKHPQLWRRIALELANRLRERSKHVKAPNPKPVVFIGSAAENLAIPRAIQTGISYDPLIPQVWTDGVFRASRVPIESLATAVRNSDFAVLAFSPDDKVYSRDAESDAPRDNVVFELGLFMGALTRDRVFIVKPRKVDIKMPSDLLGVTAMEYDADGTPDTLAARLGPVCSAIRDEVRRLGPK